METLLACFTCVTLLFSSSFFYLFDVIKPLLQEHFLLNSLLMRAWAFYEEVRLFFIDSIEGFIKTPLISSI